MTLPTLGFDPEALAGFFAGLAALGLMLGALAVGLGAVVRRR